MAKPDLFFGNYLEVIIPFAYSKSNPWLPGTFLFVAYLDKIMDFAVLWSLLKIEVWVAFRFGNEEREVVWRDRLKPAIPF